MDWDHRKTRRRAVFFQQQLVDARLWRRLQHAVRGVGVVFQSFIGAVHTNEQLHLCVVGFELVVVDGPVKSQPVSGARLEVVRAVPERHAAPVVGPAAQHAGSPPEKLFLWIGARVGVGLAGDLPAPVDCGVPEAGGFFGSGTAAQWRLIGPLEHGGFGGGIVASARL